MTFTFLYVTASTTPEASKIARHLLQKRLIACANIFPISSLYWWQGRIQEEKEAVLILKALQQKIKAVTIEIEKIHSYSIPGIMEMKVKPNLKYGKWWRGEIR
ncbi:MAG: divalent-cation tolerance protein CutA [Nanoarchaeota archaeon]